VRPRTSGNEAIPEPTTMEMTGGDMNTAANKIFGATIGGAIFFGVGVALAHAGSLIA